MKLDFNASDVQYHLYLMLINLQTDSSLWRHSMALIFEIAT